MGCTLGKMLTIMDGPNIHLLFTFYLQCQEMYYQIVLDPHTTWIIYQESKCVHVQSLSGAACIWGLRQS